MGTFNHTSMGPRGTFLQGGKLMEDRDVSNQSKMGRDERPQVAGARRGNLDAEVRQG